MSSTNAALQESPRKGLSSACRVSKFHVEAVVCGILLAGLSICTGASSEARAEDVEGLGWRLGVQAYSLNKLSFFETLDRLETLGVRYVEAFPWQPLSEADPGVTMNYTMSGETRAKVKAKLEATGVRLINYGVVPLPNDEEECRKVFEFARDLGIETQTSEPPDEAFGIIDALAQEYGINVAIHNNPEPNENWSPDIVLAECKGRSARIGVCADTSHWQRSGVDVLAALKQCEGRLICFHFGDVDGKALSDFQRRKAALKAGEKSLTMIDAIVQIPNVRLGEGPGDVMAWLREIKRQGLRPVFSIEAFYEREADDAVEKIGQCIGYLERAAASLAKE